MQRILRMASPVWLFPVLLDARPRPRLRPGQSWPASGTICRFCTKMSPNACPAPSWATTWAFPSTPPPATAPTPGMHRSSRCPNTSAASTPPIMSPVSPACACGKNSIRIRQQLIAIHTHHFAWGTERTIWMDGRPHPPEYALHTSQGFSTGKWEGDVLAVTTTHLKEGWIRRNGLPRSDRAVVTEHFIRHGDNLTIMTVIRDPRLSHRALHPHARLPL